MKTPPAVAQVVKNLSDNFNLELHKDQGSNGVIYFGQNKILKKDIVLKFYDWSDEIRAHMEPQVMETIEHKNVLKVTHAGFGSEDWAYFVTPFMKDGTVDDVIQKKEFGLRVATRLISGAAAGICEMHGKHILHRDLKSANIFVNEGDAIIGDFGSIVYIGDLKSTINSISKHSIIYRPPEAVTNNQFGVKGDIYQLGIVLYQLCGGRLDYNELAWLNDKQKEHHATLDFPDDRIYADECILDRIKKGRVIDLTTVQPYTPKIMKDIIKKCCAVDPNKRFETASHLLIALTNAMSKIHDWKMTGKTYKLEYKNGSYDLSEDAGNLVIRKKKVGKKWMVQHTFSSCKSIAQAIEYIEKTI